MCGVGVGCLDCGVLVQAVFTVVSARRRLRDESIHVPFKRGVALETARQGYVHISPANAFVITSMTALAPGTGNTRHVICWLQNVTEKKGTDIQAHARSAHLQIGHAVRVNDLWLGVAVAESRANVSGEASLGVSGQDAVRASESMGRMMRGGTNG